MEFGQRLRELRKACNLTRVELAKEAGITQYAIIHYECGHTKPRPKTLKKLTDFFGVTPDYLLRGGEGVTGNEEPKTKVDNWLLENGINFKDEENKKLSEFLSEVIAGKHTYLTVRELFTQIVEKITETR